MWVLVIVLVLCRCCSFVSGVTLRTREILSSTSSEEEGGDVEEEKPWSEASPQAGVEDRLNVTEFGKMAKTLANNRTSKAILKLVDFYKEISQKEVALKAEMESVKSKQSETLRKMQDIHRSVQADRRTELSSFQKSLDRNAV